jgi:hypothetical protein
MLQCPHNYIVSGLASLFLTGQRYVEITKSTGFQGGFNKHTFSTLGLRRHVLTTGQDRPTRHDGPVRADVTTEPYSSSSWSSSSSSSSSFLLLLLLLLICLLPHKAVFPTRPHSSPPRSQTYDRPFARPISVQNTNTADTQIHTPRVGFEPTISVPKRWKTGRLTSRWHCDWYVFNFLLPYFFRGFTFHPEPQQHTSTFSIPANLHKDTPQKPPLLYIRFTSWPRCN